MYLKETNKNYLIFNSRIWKIKKKIKIIGFKNLIGTKTFFKDPLPYNNKLSCIKNIWFFFLKIKGIGIYLEIINAPNSNFIKILSGIRNIFTSNLEKNQKKSENLKYYLRQNLIVDKIMKNKEFFILKDHVLSKHAIFGLNSEIIFTKNLKYEKSLNIENQVKKIILSTW